MRAIKLAFVATIVGLVLLTVVQSLMPFLPIIPLNEYRKPAPPPDVVGTLVRGDGRLASGINGWFDDKIGLRPLLTRLANQIGYSVFGYSRKVLIGSDGWLFERGTLDYIVGQERAAQDIELDRQKIDALAEFLHRRKIRLVVISTPAKETTLTRFLPPDVPHLPPSRRFEKLRDILKAGNGKRWLYIDSTDVLDAAHIGENEIYQHTDLHLTSEATEVIARALLDRIAESEGLAWRWHPRLEYVRERNETASSLRYLSVFSDVSEMSAVLKHEMRYSPDRPRPGESFVSSPPEPFEFIFHNNSANGRLPPTVVYGSSFLDLLLAFGAYSNFRDVYRVRHGTGKLEPTLRAIPQGTRYFVYQFWEVHSSVLRDATIPPP
jgi:hypothetical protein